MDQFRSQQAPFQSSPFIRAGGICGTPPACRLRDKRLTAYLFIHFSRPHVGQGCSPDVLNAKQEEGDAATDDRGGPGVSLPDGHRKANEPHHEKP